MNSRIAHRNAPAFAGSCAFAQASMPLLAGLHDAQPQGLREPEERPTPGDSRA